MTQDCNKNFDVKLCEIDLFSTSMLYYWLQKVFFIQKSKKDWFFQGINWKQ